MVKGSVDFTHNMIEYLIEYYPIILVRLSNFREKSKKDI